MEEYVPVYGRTYSLFGKDTVTQPFYRRISCLTDEILSHLSVTEDLALALIQRLGRKRRNLKAAASRPDGHSLATVLLQRMDRELGEFLPGLQQHLREVSIHKLITDKELFISKEQYFLYMVEFELVNRIHKKGFQEADFRIALLPYCLKDTQTDCKARPDEIDYVCRGCLKSCYINRVGRVLKDHGVHPYIWSRGSLKTMFGKLSRRHGRIGVLGIACLVELIRGMRFCMKARLPVMGIPLNANRCSRWMGELYDTSVDLVALEKILDLGQRTNLEIHN